MNRFSFLLLLPCCLALAGCFGDAPPPPPSSGDPAPVVISDVMRTGDKVTIRLTGVPETGTFVIEVQIPPSGEITVPLLVEPFHAAGRTAGDLAEEITEAYKSKRIYTTPNVTVIPEERFVSVGGDVRNPSRVLYTPDLTLLTAINSCGGFTDYAKRNSVRILRGKQVIYIDATAAARTPGADPQLYPGDQIYVPRTIL